jgi:type II secretory ATPase GspE/PulE/Tfp pilus assembly ATPase PilB-like protein
MHNNYYPIILSIVHTTHSVSQRLTSELKPICSTCQQNSDIIDERWVKKDTLTWEFIQVANCSRCNSTQYIVLETIQT